MVNLSKIVISTMVFASVNVFALAGEQCIGNESQTVSIRCTSRDAGPGVNLTVTEEQTCKDGNVVGATHSEFGYITSGEGLGAEVGVTTAKYSGVRTTDKDAIYRTAELPSLVSIQIASGTYQLEITNQLGPAFEGANEEYEWSYQGSFKKTDAKGQVTHSGKLYCNIYR